MALVICPECGKQVSDTAISCPHCGYVLKSSDDNVTIGFMVENNSSVTPVPSNKRHKKLIIGLVGVISIIVISVILAIKLLGGSDFVGMWHTADLLGQGECTYIFTPKNHFILISDNDVNNFGSYQTYGEHSISFNGNDPLSFTLKGTELSFPTIGSNLTKTSSPAKSSFTTYDKAADALDSFAVIDAMLDSIESDVWGSAKSHEIIRDICAKQAEAEYKYICTIQGGQLDSIKKELDSLASYAEKYTGAGSDELKQISEVLLDKYRILNEADAKYSYDTGTDLIYDADRTAQNTLKQLTLILFGNN